MAEPTDKPMNAREESLQQEKKEANALIGMGAGVSALATASVLTAGAMCPVCYVVVPGLLGAGAYKHYRCRKAGKTSEENAGSSIVPEKEPTLSGKAK